jgi:hypothetical protein
VGKPSHSEFLLTEHGQPCEAARSRRGGPKTKCIFSLTDPAHLPLRIPEFATAGQHMRLRYKHREATCQNEVVLGASVQTASSKPTGRVGLGDEKSSSSLLQIQRSAEREVLSNGIRNKCSVPG